MPATKLSRGSTETPLFGSSQTRKDVAVTLLLLNDKLAKVFKHLNAAPKWISVGSERQAALPHTDAVKKISKSPAFPPAVLISLSSIANKPPLLFDAIGRRTRRQISRHLAPIRVACRLFSSSDALEFKEIVSHRAEPCLSSAAHAGAVDGGER